MERDIELTVFFSSDLSVRGYADAGFGGVQVKWDVPLLDGYSYEFLPGFRDGQSLSFASPLSYGIFSRLRRGKFDAVWIHGYHTLNALHAMAAAKVLGIPVLIRSDSTLSDRPRGRAKLFVKRVFFSFLRRMVRGVLTVGKANTEYWQAALGRTVPTFLMPYAVDNDYFRARAEQAGPHREDFRRALGLRPGVPVFLFASKLQTRKRCIDLVEAFQRVAPPHATAQKAYLVIAGDGEERTYIQNRIRDTEASNMRMLGFQNQSDLPRLFDLCDVFILPSIHEPWGLIVNEVMNAARAVVVSDQVGCAPDMVSDGVNGFVFPALSVDGLADVLRRFLDDPTLAPRMGKESAKIINDFSFEQDIQGLRRALAHLVPEFRA